MLVGEIVRRSARTLFKALVLATVVVVTAAMFGVALTAAYVGYVAYRLPPPRGERLPSTIQADLGLGYTLRSNLAVTMPVGPGRIRIYTNEQGIRTVGPATGRMDHADIVAIGDSQTFGNVDYDETYPARLGKALGMTTANLGVSGYGPVSTLRRYERFASLKPRIVVWGFYFDSLDRAFSACYPGFTFSCMSVPFVAIGGDGKPRIVEARDNTAVIATVQTYFDYAAGALGPYSAKSDFIWKVRWVIAGTMQSGRPLDRLVHRRDRNRGHIIAAAKFLLSRLDTEVRRNGGRLVVLYIPDYFGAVVIPPASYLVAIAQDLGISLVDLTPTLQAAKAKGPDPIMIPGDRHLTPWANAQAANLLAAEILHDRLLGLRHSRRSRF